MAHFVVIRCSGPEWDASRQMAEQLEWAAHAAFMDRLVTEGFVLLGGPLGDDGRVLLVVDAQSQAAVQDKLASDPWSETLLCIESVEPWTIRLDGRH